MEAPLTPSDVSNCESAYVGSQYQTPASSATELSEKPPSTSDRLPHPPPLKQPYEPQNAFDDLPGVRYALDLFLASHMLESEEYCDKSDPDKSRLYLASGYAVIQCVKALMSFANETLLAAISHAKRSNQIAQQHRKPAQWLATRVAGLVTGTASAQQIAFVKSMTLSERHAELVYAESLFKKALLGIVYSGDWLAFIKEALNMRATIGIYRKLGDFVDHMDAEAIARGDGPEDRSIDAHFRSGVYLGVGTSNLILSLMPGKLMAIVELFGYHGDRQEGLKSLYRAGGWTQESHEPSVGVEQEGVRRTICDMILLIFHLVLSTITFDGIDVPMAQKILDYNLQRYPNGVFFLFGAGRLALIRSQPSRAIEFYSKAMAVQSQYRNLHHISHWEIAISNLALWDISSSLTCWRELEAEATWSKAIYTYGMAVCLWELGEVEEASKFMEKVPSLRQTIAGKSIPLEKFVARKARKFHSQGNRLAVPALEIAYLFHAIAHAPQEVISSKMLPAAEALLLKLKVFEESPLAYEGGTGYWDDYCLAKFLEGVCLRYLAYMDPDALPESVGSSCIAAGEAETRAVAAFESIFTHGPKIEFDHHIVYYAHYEFGRLLACMGDTEGSKKHFELVISGKHLEVGASGKKGKYSMESALHVRTHAASDALQKGVLRL